MKPLILLALGFLIVGCDPIWIQQSFVAVDDSEFPGCVKSAIVGLQGVAIIPDTSTPQQVVLQTPHGVAAIHPAKNGTLEVRFIGRGFYESASELEVVTPLLGSITTRLAHACKG